MLVVALEEVEFSEIYNSALSTIVCVFFERPPDPERRW